jgi:predicted PurR-regulated permease PerM
MLQDQAPSDATEAGASQTVALRILVALLLAGAAWLLAGLLVPTFLAAILAIALSPVAARLERAGVPSFLAGALCTLAVAGGLILTVGLILVPAGKILQDSDKYLSRFSRLMASAARKTGGDQVVESLGQVDPNEFGRTTSGTAGEGRSRGDGRGTGRRGGGDVEVWDRMLYRGLGVLGGWVVSGLGGLIGVVGGTIVFLALLFYMLQTRAEWIDRITESLARLGLRPSPGRLERIRDEIVAYLGCLMLVALGYAVGVGLILWVIGVPRPLLWGALAGLLEFVPYFGPLIASVLPTIVALSLGSWWQPAAVVAQYAALHLVEGYVVTPLLYGRVVRFDPVTILLGALFFGWIWGPLGLALAMPMMILLRGLLAITPDTPALDALAGVEEKEGAPDDTRPARA